MGFDEDVYYWLIGDMVSDDLPDMTVIIMYHINN